MQIHTCFTEELDTFIFTAEILPPYPPTRPHRITFQKNVILTFIMQS